ncbi:MAG: LCP family protein [Candidatus Saccharimonadales bacterium]
MNSKRHDQDKPLTFASPTFGTKFERSPISRSPLQIPEEKKKSKLRVWIKRSILIIVALLFISVVVLAWEFYFSASKLTNEHNPISLIASLWPQSPAESNGRVNILLAGYSADDPNHGGAQLTDSIMIISINPKTKTGSLISVPRDLWVTIPGNSSNKINAAFEDGAAEGFSQTGYFPGGMGLLEQVVSQDFGIRFNYYALIDYTAIRDGVNAVGGITVDINSPDPRGIYDPYTHLMLSNGEDHLNGQTALNLARTRGDGPGSYGIPDSDFTRTQYQQKELIALKDKASKLSSIFNPLTVVRLANSVGNNVVTNLKIGQMESLYRDVKGISNASIKQITLDNYNGQDLLANLPSSYISALIPAAGINNYSAIQSAVQQILYSK